MSQEILSQITKSITDHSEETNTFKQAALDNNNASMQSINGLGDLLNNQNSNIAKSTSAVGQYNTLAQQDIELQQQTNSLLSQILAASRQLMFSGDPRGARLSGSGIGALALGGAAAFLGDGNDSGYSAPGSPRHDPPTSYTPTVDDTPTGDDPPTPYTPGATPPTTGSTPKPGEPITGIRFIPGAHKKRIKGPPQINKVTGKKTAASVRYNNPGASYPRAKDVKFGLQGYGIISGGHKIGLYPFRKLGLASNMSLFQDVYTNLTLAGAVKKWRYGDKNARVTPVLPKLTFRGKPISANTILTSEMTHDRDFMLSLFQQFGKHEAGAKYALLPREEMSVSFDIANAGGVVEYNKIVIDKKATINISPNSKTTPTTTPTTTSPDSVIPSTPLSGYGVGKNIRGYDPKVEAERKAVAKGIFSFRGFDEYTDYKFNTFEAGGGGRVRRDGRIFKSAPSGTFLLSEQATGPVVSGYYAKGGIKKLGAFKKVFNVGKPGARISTGYDPAESRGRIGIQIHSNIRSDLDKLRSNGCITVPPEDYARLIYNMEKAQKALSGTGEKLTLVIENDGSGRALYRVMPSSKVINRKSISPEEAVKNFKETGNISGNRGEAEIPELTTSAVESGLFDATGDNKKLMDTLPESVLKLRVKLTGGKTTTLQDLGVTTYSELNEKGGQAFAGGKFGKFNDPNVTFMAGEIQDILGGAFNRTTAQNDSYHHGPYSKEYMSEHLQGIRLDFTINGNYNSEVKKLVSEMKSRYGLNEPSDFKIVRNFNHGTGKHVDIKFTKSGREKVLRIREERKKAGSTPEDTTTSPKSINSGFVTGGAIENITPGEQILLDIDKELPDETPGNGAVLGLHETVNLATNNIKNAGQILASATAPNIVLPGKTSTKPAFSPEEPAAMVG